MRCVLSFILFITSPRGRWTQACSIIIPVQVGAVKIICSSMEPLRKKERQGENHQN